MKSEDAKTESTVSAVPSLSRTTAQQRLYAER